MASSSTATQRATPIHERVLLSTGRTLVRLKRPARQLDIRDRIARSVRHYLEVLDELSRLNIEFVSFRENLDTGGALGRAVVVIVGAVAELERNLIIERVRAGMRRAKLEGTHIGRRPLDVDRAAVVRDRRRGLSLTEVAKAHRISRALVSLIMRQAQAASHEGCAPAPWQLDENRRPEKAA